METQSYQECIRQLMDEGHDLIIPRKPLTPFMLYHRQQIAELKTKFIKLDNKNITAQIAEKWKLIPKLKKSIYNHKYEKQLEKYKVLIEKRNCIIGKQKKPQSPYLIFFKKRFQELKEKGKTSVQLTKIISSQWSSLKPEEKSIYVEMSNVEKIVHKRKMESDKQELKKIYTQEVKEYNDQFQKEKQKLQKKYPKLKLIKPNKLRKQNKKQCVEVQIQKENQKKQRKNEKQISQQKKQIEISNQAKTNKIKSNSITEKEKSKNDKKSNGKKIKQEQQKLQQSIKEIKKSPNTKKEFKILLKKTQKTTTDKKQNPIQNTKSKKQKPKKQSKPKDKKKKKKTILKHKIQKLKKIKQNPKNKTTNIKRTKQIKKTKINQRMKKQSRRSRK